MRWSSRRRRHSSAPRRQRWRARRWTLLRNVTALDHAQRGVIPVAATKKRVDPIVWRVAATLLVVAAGTLVVFRNAGREAQIATTGADTASSSVKVVTPMTQDGGDQSARTTAKPTTPIGQQGKFPQGTAIGGSA